MKSQDLQIFLKEEYQKRLDKNSNYSLRSFAQMLQLNIGTLSSLMNGKRVFTRKTVNQLCNRLGIEPLKKQKLLDFISKHHTSKSIFKDDIKLKDGVDQERCRLENEIFRAIAEWHHWAILQLVRLDGYGSDPLHSKAKWFANRLGLNDMQVKIALDRLVEIGLLEIKNGFYKRTKEKITTKDRNTTTPALKLWQKGLREKAIQSLENDPIEKRSMTSATMAIDPAKIKDARILIEEFQEKLLAFLEEGKKEKVYQLTVSLFPLEK